MSIEIEKNCDIKINKSNSDFKIEDPKSDEELFEHFQYVQNIKIVDLNNIDFAEWSKRSDVVYIGNHPLYGTSKWTDHARDLKKFKKYIESKPKLLYTLWELDNKELGCFCSNAHQNERSNKRSKCHGAILMELRYSQLVNINCFKYVSQKIYKNKLTKFIEYLKVACTILDKTQRINYYLKVGLVSNSRGFSRFEEAFEIFYTNWYNIWKYSNGKDISEKDIMKLAFYQVSTCSSYF